ncbi:HAD-IA family hydrolase [Candidatus Woesearchaeota archaeon]|nr:HAD-IA family hydrolase [Candidatus Woesearchaeota archaeon]
MKTRLVIFDFDGVIADTFSITARIWRQYAKKTKIEVAQDDNFFRKFFELDWRLSADKWKIDKDDFIRFYNEYYKKNNPAIKIFPGIKKVLDTLSRDYILAVATNNKVKKIIPRLEEFEIKNHFQVIVGVDECEYKPSPEMLLKIIQNLKISPNQSVFIGDMDGDIIAGRQAKLKKIIAVTYGFHSKERLIDADAIVDTPEEIIEAVK